MTALRFQTGEKTSHIPSIPSTQGLRQCHLLKLQVWSPICTTRPTCLLRELMLGLRDMLASDWDGTTMDSGLCVMSACSDWLLSTAGLASPFSPFFLRREAWCVSTGMGMGEDWMVPRGELVDSMLLVSESSKLMSGTTVDRHRQTLLRDKDEFSTRWSTSSFEVYYSLFRTNPRDTSQIEYC